MPHKFHLYLIYLVSSLTETFSPVSIKVEFSEPETNSPYPQSIGLIDLNDLKDFKVKATAAPFDLEQFSSLPVEDSDLKDCLQPVDLSQLVDLESLPVETVVDTQTYNLVPNVNGVS